MIRLLACICLVLSAMTSRSATFIVQIKDYYFTPTNLTINAGDTVVWSNAAFTAHDTTSSGGLWASPALPFKATFLHTFTNGGSYPYICQAHIVAHPEQTGMVLVASASLPPSVAITNPANGAAFTAPASVTLQADAADTDGSVTNVQFFMSSTLVTSLSTQPYQATVNNLAAGSYTFTARAVDNLGLAVTSSPVSLQVLAGSLLTGPTYSNGTFQFSFNAVTGPIYVAEFSTNLLTWLPLATNTNAAVSFSFSDSTATNAARFYRVRQDLE